MVAAVRVHKVGGPEVLTYEQVDVPAPGPGQLRVKQHACGVNFIDVYFRMGLYPAPGGLPFIAGNEAAGEVVEVGSGVTEFKRRRPRRLCERTGLLHRGAAGAGRPRGQASGQHQLRAGRRHDAQGHDGGISHSPYFQGREGHERTDARRVRRRRSHSLPMGELSRRQRHRHCGVEGQSRSLRRPTAAITPSFTARRISPLASKRSPAANCATWSMTVSAKIHFRRRSTASGRSGCL